MISALQSIMKKLTTEQHTGLPLFGIEPRKSSIDPIILDGIYNSDNGIIDDYPCHLILNTVLFKIGTNQFDKLQRVLFNKSFELNKPLTQYDKDDKKTILRGIRVAMEFILCAGDMDNTDLSYALLSNFRCLKKEFKRELRHLDITDFQMRAAIAVSLGVTKSRQGSSVDEHCNDINIIERFKWIIGNNESKWIIKPEEMNTFSLRYLAASWASQEDLKWCRKKCPDDKKESIADLAGTGGSMVSYKLENAQGVSVHNGNLAYYGISRPSMEMVCRIGGVCGAQAKFGSKMCSSFGVPAMPLAQPGHCAVIYYDNKSDDWHTWNSLRPWKDCRQHSDTSWPWANYCVTPTALCALQRCLSNNPDEMWNTIQGPGLRKSPFSYRELYQRSWMYSNLTQSNLIKDPIIIEIMHFMAVIMAPCNLLAWIHYRLFYDHKIKNQNSDEVLSLSNLLEIVKKRKFNWHVVSKVLTKWMSHIDKVDDTKILSLNKKARYLIGEDDTGFPISNLTKNNDAETAIKTDTMFIEVELPNSCYVSHIDIKFWGTAYPNVLKVFNRRPDKTSDFSSITPLATEKDFIPKPNGYNCHTTIKIESNFTGKIYVLMTKGNGDGFGMGYKLGLRKLNIFGKDNSNSMFKIQPLIWGTFSVLENHNYFKSDVEWQDELFEMVKKIACVF